MHRDFKHSIFWLSLLLCLTGAGMEKAFAQAPADSVQLLQPVDQDTILVADLPVVLGWQEDAAASTYEAQVYFNEPAPGDEPIPFKSKVLSDAFFEIPTQELLDLIGASGDSTFHWRVRARNVDGEGPWSEVWQFTISGQSTIDNQPPVYTFDLTAEDRTTDELVPLEFTITATDPEGGIITYSLDQASLDAGMMIDPATGAFTWTPDESQGPGSYDVTLTATDDGVPPASSDTTITLFVNEVNSAPVLVVVADTTIEVGNALSFTALATDEDLPANTLTFSLVGGEPGMEIDATDGTFTWVPADSGQFVVQIVVTDDGDPVLSDTASVSIQVTGDPGDVNQPPVYAFDLSAEDRTTDELVALEFTISATDPEGGSIAYSLDSTSAAAGMMIDPATGAYSWTPVEAQGPGSYAVTFTATDDGMPPAASDTTITVFVNEVNVAPVLAEIQNAIAILGEQVQYTFTATDQDVPANDLAFSLQGAAPGMDLDPQTGEFSWVPSSTGVFGFTVVVTDNGTPPLADSQAVEIAVQADPPGITQSEILSSPFCSLESTSLLEWAPVQADSYRVEIDTDPLFSSPDVITVTASTNFEAPIASLDTDVVYYWRVAAGLGGALGVPSPPQPFRRWPATIQVQHVLSFPKATESADFRMVSVPGQSEQITVQSTFPGQTPFDDWRVYTDDSEDVAYPIYLSPVDPAENSGDMVFRPGRGFWALSTSSWQVAAQQIPSATLDAVTNSFFAIPLAQGASEADARWTMIGNPFDFPIRWTDILDANAISGDDELWDWTQNGYVASAVMAPYKGYYFFNRDNNPSLRMPCYLEPATDLTNSAPPEHNGLVLSVVAPQEGDHASVSSVDIGWHEDATEALDAYDTFIPPAFFESYRLTLVNEDLETTYPFLKKEFRKSVEESQVFNIQLKSVPGERVAIRAAGLDALALQEVYLFDEATGQAFNLHENPDVYVEPEQEISTLKLVIGDDTFIAEQKAQLIPDGFQVKQSYPNPFTDRMMVEYSLPEQGFVELAIYNVLGQRVRTLLAADKEAGFHRVEWDGTSDAGEAVASGVYIYVFTSGSYQHTQRLVRVR